LQQWCILLILVIVVSSSKAELEGRHAKPFQLSSSSALLLITNLSFLRHHQSNFSLGLPCSFCAATSSQHISRISHLLSCNISVKLQLFSATFVTTSIFFTLSLQLIFNSSDVFIFWYYVSFIQLQEFVSLAAQAHQLLRTPTSVLS